ncbi:pyrroloquinoline quinone biosynthesis protein PqqB [Aquabacter spiritensis]|uniref:Coenzyme PQQ synthesis protein B n=1 Tax=Aquabacter spiritensis TaxID=933073 RepID=A0A4R3LZR5_9HYPH|nr:pyrroloquinoline quinone biosynthesis protein PqqB [Aquabacter spiritensis]TCT04277.1 pyrroloquinoline quinone biosynthesis protein B [Aquabacter spiritensis]
MKIIVLGSAAGGGVPQWNCRCRVCELARAGDPRVRARSQCGLAVSRDGEDWLLVNASPDLRTQILATPALAPRAGLRSSPIAAVVLTNGEIDHVAGLLALRERQPFHLCATPGVFRLLDANPMFSVLSPDVVRRIELVGDLPSDLCGLRVTPFGVPGKMPLYAEGEGPMEEEILGLDISADGGRCLVVPNCARIDPALCKRLDGADLLLFDGTTYSDDEMIRLGLSEKSAARMGHVAMAGEGGALAGLAGVSAKRKVFIHINNSNPALIEDGPERRCLRAAGWDLAQDGMEIDL